MSAVIKASSRAAHIRSFLPTAAVAIATPPTSDPELVALREALARSEAERSALAGELAASEDRVPQLIDAARREGIREGAKQVEAEHDRRTETFGRAIEAAHADWRERIDRMDALAAALARAAVAKVLGEAPDYADLVTRTVTAQCRELDRRSIVMLNVSAEDFEEDDAVTLLAAGAGLDPGLVRRDPDLSAGGCRLDLKLGGLDLDVDRQWRELDALLAALAEPAP